MDFDFIRNSIALLRPWPTETWARGSNCRQIRIFGTNSVLPPFPGVAIERGDGTLLYWFAYGIPTVILLAVLIYGVHRAGWFGPLEERQLDANTRTAQERDDPQRRRG